MVADVQESLHCLCFKCLAWNCHFRSFSNLGTHRVCSRDVFHSPISVVQWLHNWGGFYVHSTDIRNSRHASPYTRSTSNIPVIIYKYSRGSRNSVWEFSHVYWNINEQQMSALSSGSIAYNSTWKLWHLHYCTDTFFTGNILNILNILLSYVSVSSTQFMWSAFWH